MIKVIPLFKPYWDKKEEQACVRALRSTNGAGDGANSKKLIQMLQKILRVFYVFPVTSCSHGLELACLALDVDRGDEIIVPSFTMSSTANCVLRTGATPIFADIDPQTYCIDPADIERVITKRTKGIIVVHYAGMAADMKKIMKIARKHKLFVIEDAAHAIGASYEGKKLGTIGDIGVFSFHASKNVSCGEGGAVVTNRKDLVTSINEIRANGTNRTAFLHGQVDKYTWMRGGSSYFLSDILASIVVSQLGKLQNITRKRTAIAKLYTKILTPFTDDIQLPVISKGTIPNWHIYGISFRNSSGAQRFMGAMKKAGIGAVLHYVALHSSPMGRKISGKKYKTLPVTEHIAETLVRLPVYPGLTKKEFLHITRTFVQYFSSEKNNM